MPTNKLGLPTVTENMTHDVPRDLNALANAVDEAAGTKLATLDADGQISSSQVRPIPGLSTHMNDLTKHISFGVATGTANAYAVSISPAPSSYSDFLAVSVRINADSNGPSTLNVNGLGARPLKKANGNDAVGLKANGIYTFRYNASTAAFILQGEGGNGNAQPEHVLMGKTFSNDYGDQTGTMNLTNLVPGNVKRGVTIHNVTGTVYEDTVQTLTVGRNRVLNDLETVEYYRAPNEDGSFKVKEVRLNRPGAVRVTFSAQKPSTTQALRFYLYVNGTQTGVTHQKIGTNSQSFVEDITGLKEGDLIKLYASNTGAGSVIIDSFEISIGNDLPYVTQTMK